ncbi:MAG: DUF4384 domain-containing protein [Deltaproteobacteria bacterium]|nr:DUF4384 domain-containing protein [Deltaproteobacteria bacterium]
MKLAAALLGAALALPAAPAPASAAPGANPITITMSMRASRNGKKFAVLDGDVLKTGDEVEMFVNVNQPAYVYVVQFYADGTSAVLFPQECPEPGKPRPTNGCGDVLASPGTDLRVPEAGDAFALDDNKGAEHVYFLATRDPIAKADKAIAGVIDNIRRTTVEPAPAATPPPPPRKTPPDAKKPPPPSKAPTVGAIGAAVGAAAAEHIKPGPMLTMQTRKLKRIKRPDGQPATEGEADSRDGSLVVMRFSFQHE